MDETAEAAVEAAARAEAGRRWPHEEQRRERDRFRQGASWQAAQVEPVHDDHARLAPELVALLASLDADAENDNYSKGDAADAIRAALRRACGCDRGVLPHSRRCPDRAPVQPAPEADEREALRAAKADAWDECASTLDMDESGDWPSPVLDENPYRTPQEAAARRSQPAPRTVRPADAPGMEGYVAYWDKIHAETQPAPRTVTAEEVAWAGRSQGWLSKVTMQEVRGFLRALGITVEVPRG